MNPAAVEVCDGVDNDCDDRVDDADDVVDEGLMLTFFRDDDGDGYGEDGEGVRACAEPEGYSALLGDCDDGDAGVHPSAQEVCGGEDEDCDGLVDDADDSVDTGDGVLVYADGDGDGFGEEGTARMVCTPGVGEVLTGSDCDDTDAWAYPGAREWCDGVDNDCDASTSEDGTVSWEPAGGDREDWTTILSSASGLVSLDLKDAGTLSVCAGVWPVSLRFWADVEVVGVAGSGRTTLSAEREDRVLAILTDGITVDVSGVQITNGVGSNSIDFVDGYGGAVLCEADAVLSLREVDILGNSTGGMGGGVMNRGCDLTIQDSLIRDNSAEAGGGIAVYGGTLILQDTEVSDNSASIAGGGVMAYYSGEDRSSVVLLDVQITGNGALAAGGVYVNNADVSCSGSKGASNAGIFANAALSGGGIYVDTDLTRRSVFTSARCDYGTSGKGNDNAPSDVSVGGLLYSYGSDASFSCTGLTGCK